MSFAWISECCTAAAAAAAAPLLQAISTAADLAKIHNSKITVLVVDQPGAEGDPTVKLQVINKVGGPRGADCLQA
jgi:hypothetical protein